MSLLLEALKQAERENRLSNPVEERDVGQGSEVPCEREASTGCDFELIDPDPGLQVSTSNDTLTLHDESQESVAPALSDSSNSVPGEFEDSGMDFWIPSNEEAEEPLENHSQENDLETDTRTSRHESVEDGTTTVYQTNREESDKHHESTGTPQEEILQSLAVEDAEDELAPASASRLLEVSIRKERRKKLVLMIVSLVLILTVPVIYRFASENSSILMADAMIPQADQEPAVDYADPSEIENVPDFSRLQPVRIIEKPDKGWKPAAVAIHDQERRSPAYKGSSYFIANNDINGTGEPDKQMNAVAAITRKNDPLIQVRTRTMPERDRRLRIAYRLLHRGDFSEARALYKNLLEAHPRDLDALLGLASVEITTGNDEAARRLYAMVLKSDPDNSYAKAGLELLSGVDASKLMNRVNNSELVVALASLKARQGKWKDAQRLYFKAHAANPNDPVSLYGLAVSMDHLEKPEIALKYYRLALATEIPGINASDIQARIAQLEQAGISGTK